MSADKSVQTEPQQLPDGFYPRCSESTPIRAWGPVGKCLWCGFPFCSWEIHCEGCKRRLVKIGREMVSRDTQTYTTSRGSSTITADVSEGSGQGQTNETEETLPFSQNAVLSQSEPSPSSTQLSAFDHSQ